MAVVTNGAPCPKMATNHRGRLRAHLPHQDFIMCDIEGDGQCPVWDEQERTARRSHVCSGCGETVSPGHRYRRTATLWEGSWSTYKHCRRCVAIVDALRPVLGERFTTETLDLNCGEVWEEPPEHVAALAFLLPGEPVTAFLGAST